MMRQVTDTDHSPLLDQLRAELREVIKGERYFEDFWEWLRSLQRQVVIASPEARLLYQIIGRFEEYDAGCWTDDEFMAELEKLSTKPAPLHVTLSVAVEERLPGPVSDETKRRETLAIFTTALVAELQATRTGNTLY